MFKTSLQLPGLLQPIIPPTQNVDQISQHSNVRGRPAGTSTVSKQNESVPVVTPQTGGGSQVMTPAQPTNKGFGNTPSSTKSSAIQRFAIKLGEDSVSPFFSRRTPQPSNTITGKPTFIDKMKSGITNTTTPSTPLSNLGSGFNQILSPVQNTLNRLGGFKTPSIGSQVKRSNLVSQMKPQLVQRASKANIGSESRRSTIKSGGLTDMVGQVFEGVGSNTGSLLGGAMQSGMNAGKPGVEQPVRPTDLQPSVQPGVAKPVPPVAQQPVPPPVAQQPANNQKYMPYAGKGPGKGYGEVKPGIDSAMGKGVDPVTQQRNALQGQANALNARLKGRLTVGQTRPIKANLNSLNSQIGGMTSDVGMNKALIPNNPAISGGKGSNPGGGLDLTTLGGGKTYMGGLFNKTSEVVCYGSCVAERSGSYRNRQKSGSQYKSSTILEQLLGWTNKSSVQLNRKQADAPIGAIGKGSGLSPITPEIGPQNPNLTSNGVLPTLSTPKPSLLKNNNPLLTPTNPSLHMNNYNRM